MTACVTVGLPVFNGARYLPAALDAVLSQTHTCFEVLISDNASTDGTRDICADYMKRDSRVKYCRHSENIGAPRNFHFVMQQARSEYFKWATANDLCDSQTLEKCLDVLKARPDVVLCYGRTRAIDEQGATLRICKDQLALDDGCPARRFLHIVDNMGANNVFAGVFRTAALRQTKKEGLFPAADLVLVAELALYGKFYEIPEILTHRRETVGTASRFRSAKELRQVRAPQMRGTWKWPELRRSVAYYEAVLRSDLAVHEKMSLCIRLARRIYWKRQTIFNEICQSL